MRKVIFRKDIQSFTLEELPDDTLIVVHEMYDAPNIDRRVIEWQKFKANYIEHETSQYILVGANRMISPSNRCDMVNDFLQVMTKTIPKVSIDTSPFIGEPWRLWYHYSLAFGVWMGADYSYPIEGEWKKWFYYEINSCKFLPQNIQLFANNDNTDTDLSPLWTKFDLYDPNKMDIEFYEEAKKYVFDKYDTPKLLISNLLKVCNKHFSKVLDFDSYLTNKDYLLPDFGVYRFLIEENKRRLAIYNCFTK